MRRNVFILLALVAVVVWASVPSPAGAQESVAKKRFDRASFLAATPDVRANGLADRDRERRDVVAALTSRVSDPKLADADRISLIATFRSLATKDAVHYCVANVSLKLRHEPPGSIQPDMSRPCHFVLKAMSAGQMSEILRLVANTSVSPDDLPLIASALAAPWDKESAAAIAAAAMRRSKSDVEKQRLAALAAAIDKL